MIATSRPQRVCSIKPQPAAAASRLRNRMITHIKCRNAGPMKKGIGPCVNGPQGPIAPEKKALANVKPAIPSRNPNQA